MYIQRATAPVLRLAADTAYGLPRVMFRLAG